jgi:hypothetical protein
MDRFDPGDTIVLRGLHQDGRIATADSMRVLSDDDLGLVTWMARGSQAIPRSSLSGAPTRRKMPLADQLRIAKIHVLSISAERDVLWLTPSDSEYAVAWSFTGDGEFEGWYINLQSRARRWWGGIDIRDYALDVLARADRT